MLPAVNRDLFTLLARERQEQRRADAALERVVRAHRSTTSDATSDPSRGSRRRVGALALPALYGLHEWALSLPWVVERPSPRWPRGVRLFGVDCTPVARRRMWLTTHAFEERRSRSGFSVSVVLPEGLSESAERAGWDVSDELPAGHVLVTTERDSDSRAPTNLGSMLLTAYIYALL